MDWPRYPHILFNIVGYLDNKSLTNCKLVNKTWRHCIDNNITIWRRIIAKMSINEENSNKWKHLLDKIPFDIIKEIGAGLIKFLSDIENENDRSYNFLKHSPLHTTAALGLLKASKYIIENVTDTNSVDISGRTALHYAAVRGHVEVCRLIIDNVSDKNPSDGGDTVLHWAAGAGHVEICRLIMANVTDKNPADPFDGMTPLHFAAVNGHLETCRLIMANISNKNPASGLFKRGRTPLHLAAQKGRLEVCQLIMDNVSDKNREACGVE